MMRTTTPILSILIAVLLFLFFTHPEYVKTMEIKNEIEQYREARNTYEQFSARLGEKYAKKTGRSAYEIERLDALIPEEADETRHLVDLEMLAEKNSLLFGNTAVDSRDLTSIKRDKESATPSEELRTTDISFEVVGTYGQVKSFLADLESSLVIFEVTDLSFTVVEGPFQQFKITVRTYALPEAS